MRAVVIYSLDDVVREDVHTGTAITAKIHPDGRGYIKADDVDTLYRHVHKITVWRGEDE